MLKQFLPKGLAVLLIVSLAALALPVESAPLLPVDCSPRAADARDVFAPPGAAEVTNWAPPCVRITDGGTVTFTNLDALPHRPVAAGCFDLGNIGLGASAAVSLSFDEEVGTVVGFEDGIPADCDMEALQQREGRIPFGSQGDALPVIEFTDDSVVVHYICSIHGAAMKGVIEIER